MGRTLKWIAAGLTTVLLAACVLDGSVSDGNCTMALVAMGSGEHFDRPYRLELVGGEAQVILDGDGWSRQVSYTESLPDGETEEAEFDGRLLNEAQYGESFYILGVHRLAFRDGQGCRQEFDVEVIPPSR